MPKLTSTQRNLLESLKQAAGPAKIVSAPPLNETTSTLMAQLGYESLPTLLTDLEMLEQLHAIDVRQDDESRTVSVRKRTDNLLVSASEDKTKAKTKPPKRALKKRAESNPRVPLPIWKPLIALAVLAFLLAIVLLGTPTGLPGNMFKVLSCYLILCVTLGYAGALTIPLLGGVLRGKTTSKWVLLTFEGGVGVFFVTLVICLYFSERHLGHIFSWSKSEELKVATELVRNVEQEGKDKLEAERQRSKLISEVNEYLLCVDYDLDKFKTPIGHNDPVNRSVEHLLVKIKTHLEKITRYGNRLDELQTHTKQQQQQKFFQSLVHYCRREYQAALDELGDLHGDVSVHANADLVRAACYERFGNVRSLETLEAIRLVRETYPGDLYARCFEAMILYRMNKFADAMVAYDSVRSGSEELTVSGDELTVRGSGILGKMVCQMICKQNGALTTPIDHEAVQKDLQFVSANFEQASMRESVPHWKILTYRRSIGMGHFCASHLDEPQRREEHLQSAIEILTDVEKEPSGEIAQPDLVMALCERVKIYRERANSSHSKADLEGAYRDAHQAAKLSESINKRNFSDAAKDVEMFAEPHLNAGEVALGLGPEFVRDGEGHAQRAVDILKEPAEKSENLRVIRARALMSLMFYVCKHDRGTARAYATEIVKSLSPLVWRRNDRMDLLAKIEVAKAIIKKCDEPQ